ncbi:calmodulin binding protein PICBP-like [Andrographis paniculata]|uniref:calmodulin binding protein PICBP-like n=1 Tax=Andrographis paniculata TaxID=175694 RepID=UPI0021E782BA|nr:calmodulin binding protein PICBP-like [Andrographis paniculata]
MESVDSSPNYVKSSCRSDAKKEVSSGGSECDDNISLSSSTGKSAIKGLRNTGIKYRRSNKKTVKSFGSVRSFRRRTKTILVQSPAAEESDDAAAFHSGSLVDSSASSPHYLKATSSSQGKKTTSWHSESPSDGNTSPFSQSKLGTRDKKALMSRSSSIRTSRFQLKMTSFKRRVALNYSKVSEDASVDRATYSSAIKDSKFPERVEIHHGGKESENLSVMKVCRYHHCSLHGHCHGADDPAPQPKRFLYKRRLSMKKQRGMKSKTNSNPGAKQSGSRKKEHQKNQASAVVESSDQESISNKVLDDFPAGSYSSKQESDIHGNGYDDSQEVDLTKVAFVETPFPKRSHQEDLSIMRKHSFKGEDFGEMHYRLNGHCLGCSCHNRGQVMTYAPTRPDADISLNKSTSTLPDLDYGDKLPQNGYANGISPNSSFNEPTEQFSDRPEHDVIPSCANDASNEDPPAAPATTEVTENTNVSYTPSDSQSPGRINSDEERDAKTESTLDGDSKVDETMQDSVTDSPAHIGNKLKFSKPRHISMWHLIHQHMSSNMGIEHPAKPLQAADGESLEDDSTQVAGEISAPDGALSDSQVAIGNTEPENQEIEIHRLFAIKIVREAIEKILLPEVQDQASDDHSVTSESPPQAELGDKNQSEEFKEDHYVDLVGNVPRANTSSHVVEKSHMANDASGSEVKETHDTSEIQKQEKKVVSRSEKSAPRHWSYLKKWFLLQKFIRALEKVRKFKKPHHLPLSPDPEAEKVNLRPQTVDERKTAEEWMLDYALRQAVDQLAPTQKKKVALLVKAFETVVPQQETVPLPRTRLTNNNGSINSTSYKGNESVIEDPDSENSIPSAQSSILDHNGKPEALKNLEKLTSNEREREAFPEQQGLQAAENGKEKDGDRHNFKVDRKSHIKMWHMIYQHVVSGIAEKVGSQLLDGACQDNDGEESKLPVMNNGDYSNDSSSNMSSSFTKSDALKLIKDAVDEILRPENQDDSDTQSVTSESIPDLDISERNFNELEGQNISSEDKIAMNGEKTSFDNTISIKEEETTVSKGKGRIEPLKSKNWSKVKKLMLLKRSIKALEKVRNLKMQTRQLLPQMLDPEPEKIELRQQVMDERKKAEQWMLDYAVQHIVTKLTPARKRRVSMLVEAFEAVVPIPEI